MNDKCAGGTGAVVDKINANIRVHEYADIAFAARTMPLFGYGCAVFMQSDIVNFQRQGWQAEEILAGLAAVLPKNIFLYGFLDRDRRADAKRAIAELRDRLNGGAALSADDVARALRPFMGA